MIDDFERNYDRTKEEEIEQQQALDENIVALLEEISKTLSTAANLPSTSEMQALKVKLLTVFSLLNYESDLSMPHFLGQKVTEGSICLYCSIRPFQESAQNAFSFTQKSFRSQICRLCADFAYCMMMSCWSCCCFDFVCRKTKRSCRSMN